ncbi:hypothetical protein [Amantichitinum ursilacus]|uniref:Glycosyltransferase RgtA/B/C/D-like domain-containing protein n=1 Tax=Amantichitinum ursilacus TaxID=857265 RepID=A0A0N0XIS7_9NEIS|nr:hypothetical protein [Amantichitinum ursilacus]KPC50403.1 hypothetical protein WG78_17385 [Amantichitinum ursilacus]
MPKPSNNVDPKAWLFALFVLSVLLAAFLILRGTGNVEDPFLQGEYFASSASLLTTTPGGFEPLTIHGALDYLPAMVTRAIWGPTDYFVPTLMLYKLLRLLAGALLFVVAYQASRGKPHQALLVFGVGVMATQLVNYRDLMWLASLYVWLLLTGRSFKPAAQTALLVLFGALVGLGMFWSYDRGLTTIVALGGSTLWMAVRDKRFVISLVVFVGVVALLGALFETCSLSNYAANIKVLMDTSAQWSYGLQRWPVILTILTSLVNITALTALIYTARHSLRFAQRPHAGPQVLGFVLASLMMFKIGINRADVDHIYWSMWIPALIALTIYGRDFAFPRYLRIAAVVLVVLALPCAAKFHHPAFVLVTGLLALAISTNKPTFTPVRWAFVVLIIGTLGLTLLTAAHNYRAGQYAWIEKPNAWGDNAAASPEGVRWAAEQVLASQSGCLLDLSNNGVINGLTRLPSCTRFTYLVYAGPANENELIDAVRSSAPKAVVYSTTEPSYTVDGRSMRERFPQLDAYLVSQYPDEKCNKGYCIRYQRG